MTSIVICASLRIRLRHPSGGCDALVFSRHASWHKSNRTMFAPGRSQPPTTLPALCCPTPMPAHIQRMDSFTAFHAGTGFSIQCHPQAHLQFLPVTFPALWHLPNNHQRKGPR